MTGPAHPIRNPVLPGFNPDPSLLRVGDSVFLATSTFQWWPGVPVYESRDMATWRLRTRVLDRPSQLDLAGVAPSGGVYAPQISYRDGRYFLVFTNTQSNAWPYMDTPNFVVHAPSVDGPWSDAIRLHARGFDPSLFHDDDGRSWLLSNEIDFRHPRRGSAGIIVQEFDPVRLRLKGEPVAVYPGDAEGPHLFRRKGHLYLLVAEGGTRYNHRALVLRGRSPLGPFQPSPYGEFITTRGDPHYPLQKAGHASLVEMADGSWWAACLASRPLADRRCPLGRETCVSPVEWTPDDWPRLAGGGRLPPLVLAAQPRRSALVPKPTLLPPGWQTLREPVHPSWCTIDEPGGTIRLRGRQSPFSLFEQSLVAWRLTSFEARFVARVDAEPRDYRQAAGVVAYYDHTNFLALTLSAGSGGRRRIQLLRVDGPGSSGCDLLEGMAGLPADAGRVRMWIAASGGRLRFGWRDEQGREGGPAADFDLGELSDDHRDKYGFTGAFLGVLAFDLGDRSLEAAFDEIELRQETGGVL